MIAALFVETDGCYFGLPDVDPWDETRDALLYDLSHPVVCHPECTEWGRFATSHPILGANYRPGGQDGGHFAFSLASARRCGGVIEHPADSGAWAAHGLAKPKRGAGWQRADMLGGWGCYVEQGHYGHFSRKGTFLYAFGVHLPELIWTPAAQRLPAYAVERYGYEKARRIGVMAAVGGKNKTRIRRATPPAFRDILLSMARTAIRSDEQAA